MLLLLPLINSADGHSATNPAEAWMCSLKKGKTKDDVRSFSKAVSALSKKNGNQEGYWLFTPLSCDMQDQGRFFLMTAWKDFPTMGASFAKFFAWGWWWCCDVWMECCRGLRFTQLLDGRRVIRSKKLEARPERSIRQRRHLFYCWLRALCAN